MVCKRYIVEKDFLVDGATHRPHCTDGLYKGYGQGCRNNYWLFGYFIFKNEFNNWIKRIRNVGLKEISKL